MTSQPAAVGAETDLLRRARELATEQAAMRQVATLVARESTPDQLFAVVPEQVARIVDVPHVRLVRYEPDGSVVAGGFRECGQVSLIGLGTAAIGFFFGRLFRTAGG
jgi:hypothetical protein